MALKLSNLSPNPGAVKSANRVGRGQGSGNGKTCGKGHGGQNSRGCGKVRVWFEGGQMPLQRRIPKRGFKNRFKKEWQVVNVDDLARCEGADMITPEILKANGLIRSATKAVKLLGNGEVSGAFTVEVHAASEQAKKKVEAAGGTVKLPS